MSLRPRARSTASSAPPKTLWSVTAIAPSPSASAWSSRSSTSIEQSCDQVVCMCRSATIQSRSLGGARRAAARRAGRVSAVDLLDAVGERAEALRRGRRAPSSLRCARKRGVLEPGAPPRPRRARAGARAPGGAAIADAGRLRLERLRAAQPSSAGTKTARVAQHGRAALAVEPVRTRTPSAQRARERRAPARAAACAGARAPSRAARRARARSRAGAAARAAATRATTDVPLLAAARSRSRSTPQRHELGSRPGSAAPQPRAVSSARREQRVEPAEQPLALRPAAAGTRAARARRTSPTVSASESRSARYERLGQAGLEAVDDVEAAAGERDREVRADADGHAHAAAARDRHGGAERDEVGVAGRVASARRPAARSRARFDGASTVDRWPRARSSSASPATCSLTSCGCDQENGVTRAIRNAIVPGRV